jgi:hypothetical protein
MAVASPLGWPALLLLLFIGISTPVSDALLCDPKECQGLATDDDDVVCDLSCHISSIPDSIPFGDNIPLATGCIPETLCRRCAKEGGTTALKSCRTTRLDSYLHALPRLAEIPTVQTTQDVLTELRPVVEQFFAPETSNYTITSVGTFMGHDAQIEYLTTTQPVSNFNQYRFIKSRARLPLQWTTTDDGKTQVQFDWEITAVREGRTFLGVQPTVLQYDDETDMVVTGRAQLDFSILLFLWQSDFRSPPTLLSCAT